MKVTTILFITLGLAVAVNGQRFRKHSLDIDALTFPQKFRPGINDFPAQLNTTVNGAIYLGYRNDIYRYTSNVTPFGKRDRQITHFGFSIGAFTGIGSAAVNPWVTTNQINSEYTGLVVESGFAGMVGIKNFSVGLGIGFDHLVDRNEKKWMYDGKPWLGLALGVNLN